MMGFKTSVFVSSVCLLYTILHVFCNIAREMHFELCGELKGRFRVLYGVGIESCKYECGRRPDCFHLRYQLSRTECGLYGIAKNETEVFGFESSDEIELDLRVNKTCAIIERSQIDMTKCHCSKGMACRTDGSCLREECPPAHEINQTRGVVKGNMQHIGAKVKVHCNKGYTRIPDNETVVCGNDGQWGEFPKCLWGCPPVQQMDSARGYVQGTRQDIGANVTVQCNEGFVRVPDIEIVVCGHNGQWGEFPQCLWDCSEPCPRLPYTNNVSSGRFLEGDTRNYTCMDGFYVNDTNQSKNITIVCTLEGWNYSISSQLCVNESIRPNNPENAVIMTNCMILEFNFVNKTYDESQEQCRRYGDLVRVDTDEKQKILRRYMKRSKRKNGYWIQGKRTGGEWRYSDGTVIDQLFWAPEEPTDKSDKNRDCFIIRRGNHFWMDDKPCYRKKGYICEYTDI